MLGAPAPTSDQSDSNFLASSVPPSRGGRASVQNGQEHVAEALHLAAAGGDWVLMDTLWSESVLSIVAQDPELVASTLEGLPDPVLARRPSMQALRQTLKLRSFGAGDDGYPATLRVFADECARLIRTRRPTIPLSELLMIGTGYLIHLRLLGQVRDAAAFAGRMNARVETLSQTQPAAADTLAWFHLERGITCTLLDDQGGAVRSYQRSWELARGSAFAPLRCHAAANLALSYSAAGDTERAERWLERQRTVDNGDGTAHEVSGIGGHLAAGLLALDRLDGEEVSAQLACLGDESAQFELWPFVAYLRAQYALHAGGTDEALAQLDRVQHRHEEVLADEGVWPGLVTRARADLLIAGGRGMQAESTLHLLGRPSPMSRVPTARIALLRGDRPGSDGEFALDQAISTQDRLEVLLLAAASALRGGDRHTAGRLADRALSLYRDTGILRPFATIDSPSLAELLSLADDGLEPRDLAKVTAAAPVYPTTLVLVQLSGREQSVLWALAGTGSRQAIADSLYVSVNTVKTQLASVYRKLGTKTREETLSRAADQGMLSHRQT
jgi:LuxR family transcriptional regulator, maltose regulon positive regulatory protein